MTSVGDGRIVEIHKLFVQRPGASAADSLYEALTTAIERGLIVGGARLSEQQLASMFAVSRTPVRETITRLVGQQMLERSDRGELVVSSISQQEIVDVYMVRQVLEALAARLASRAAKIVELAQLRSLTNLSEESLSAGDLSQTASLQASFHETLTMASHNETLIRSLNVLHRVMRRYLANSQGGIVSASEGYITHVRDSLTEHRQILDALERGDGPRSEELVRRHMERALELRIRLMVTTPPRE